MGTRFAPTWLRQVSPLLHMTTLTTGCSLLFSSQKIMPNVLACYSAIRCVEKDISLISVSYYPRRRRHDVVLGASNGVDRSQSLEA